MFIFIDESGITNLKSNQKYLVVSFAIMKNKAFAEEIIFEIKDKCKSKGKPIKKKEVRFHDLEPLQKEIAVQVINSKYRKFYICFVDLEKTDKSMVTGTHEHEIQTKMIHNVLLSFDKNELRKKRALNIIMDKKLSKKYQESIKAELQRHFGTKKGICVKALKSSSSRGIQLADVLAGAFRAKLMKKSDLFQVAPQRVYQITISDQCVANRKKLE